MRGAPRLAVVGHTEWVEFATVDRLPARGEIAHAQSEFAVAAGGGAVAAVQLARLAGNCEFHTALGRDALGERAGAELAGYGVALGTQLRSEPTRRALTLVDDGNERTIITIGDRLEPRGDELADLADLDAVFFTAGDSAALASARRAARTLTLTPRATQAAGDARVQIDALILSAGDSLEVDRARTIEQYSRLTIRTDGAAGGEWTARDGASGTWSAAPVPGAPRDTYGCGDTFAAGVTYGLAAGIPLDGALALGARCAAKCLTGRGPYEQLLGGEDL